MFMQLFSEVRGILEERLSRLKRRAIGVAVAAVLLTLASLFALLGAFIVLQERVGPAAAAFIIFIVLAVGGVVALMAGREKKAKEASRQLQTSAAVFQPKSAEETALTSSGWPLILTAFAAGLALSRARLNGWRKDRH
jgi:Kef-type K+ transport system membrane component KefB